MKGRAIIPLAVGLAIGVFAIKYFVSVVKKAQGASTDVVQVVVANSDIQPTVEILDAMLEVKTLPKALAPKMYVSDRKEVIGRVAGQPIVTGMPIVPSLLAPKGTPAGLAVRIPQGFRAVTVQVDEFAGVAGWIKPGSHVDVVAVMSGKSGSSNETISKVILQNIQVLTVGQDIGGSSEAAATVPKSATLAVVPKDVPLLHLAATRGKIRLAMRNVADTESKKRVPDATDNTLVGDADGQKKGAAAKAGGLLAGFFSNLPKPEAKATDKEPRTQEPQPATQPAVVVDKRDWVQVYRGSEFKEELAFSRNGESWRLVGYRGKKSLEEDKGDFQDVGGGAPSPSEPGRPSLFSRPLD